MLTLAADPSDDPVRHAIVTNRPIRDIAALWAKQTVVGNSEAGIERWLRFAAGFLAALKEALADAAPEGQVLHPALDGRFDVAVKLLSEAVTLIRVGETWTAPVDDVDFLNGLTEGRAVVATQMAGAR